MRTITGSQSRVSRSGLGLGTYPLFYKPGNAQPYLLTYHPALGMDMPLKPLANLQPKAALEVPGGAVDFYQDAKVHYRELHQYLSFFWPAVLCTTSSEVLFILAADDLLVLEITAGPNHRAGARSRSARLRGPQFQRLSTDCYEDLLRKTRVGERKVLAPHLPVDGPTAVPTRIKDDTYATVPKHGAREAVGAPAAALHGHAE